MHFSTMHTCLSTFFHCEVLVNFESCQKTTFSPQNILSTPFPGGRRLPHCVSKARNLRPPPAPQNRGCIFESHPGGTIVFYPSACGVDGRKQNGDFEFAPNWASALLSIRPICMKMGLILSGGGNGGRSFHSKTLSPLLAGQKSFLRRQTFIQRLQRRSGGHCL